MIKHEVGSFSSRDHAGFGADAFKLTSLRLRNDEAHKEKREDTEDAVDRKGECVSCRFDQREERKRDKKVRRAGADRRRSNTSSAYLQRKHLRDEDPRNGSHAEREAGNVEDQADRRKHSQRRAESGLIVERISEQEE